MARATTTERSRAMKRTRNGILIPDVPIMAGGNLPNAVKGVSSGGGEKDYSRIPFFIDVKKTISLNNKEGLEISIDKENWSPVTQISLNAGIYYFRSNTGQLNEPSILFNSNNYDSEATFEIGGNINSLIEYNFADDNLCHNYAFAFESSGYNVTAYGKLLTSAERLHIPSITNADSSIMDMFYNNEALLVSPTLRMVDIPYNPRYFLTNCISLKRVTILSNAVQLLNTNWAEHGIFFKKRGTLWRAGSYGIPSGWTVEEVD